MAKTLADLGDFLAALRTGGVPVGPTEIARLRSLFRRTSYLDRDGLKTLIGALLIKTPEHRGTFEALFAEWCPDLDADWLEEVGAEPGRERAEGKTVSSAKTPDLEPEDEQPTPRKTWWLWPSAALLALALASLLWVLSSSPRTSDEPTLTAMPALTWELGTTSASLELPDKPVEHVWFWQAEIDTAKVTAPLLLAGPWLVLLGWAALVLALLAVWRYRRKHPDIRPPTDRKYRGAGYQPLPPPERDDNALVARGDRRQLVWNIERFVADEPTRRLDLERTVDASARSGGFIRLCFEAAVYDREIWFWVDRQLTRRTPWTAVKQLLETLSRAGLQARRGFFTELPLRVDWPGQPGYRPEAQEGQGRQALVAILSDGEGLERRLGNLRAAGPAERLLRALRRWPRLCFVDCSTEGDRLEALLAPFGLDVVALERLPYWLGGVEAGAPLASPLGGGLYGAEREWAAALALGGMSTDTEGAQTLRVHLGLEASPWRVDRVLAEAERNRVALINWLLRRDPPGEDGYPQPETALGKALVWWRQRYRDAAREMAERENPLLPWAGSLAGRRWQLEQALLRLYDAPELTADRLTELADDRLRGEIQDRLADFAGAEHRRSGGGDERFIYLTWRLADLPDLTRHRLRRLGFASELGWTSALSPLGAYPLRLLLVLGTLIGLGVAALGVGVYRWMAENPPRLVVENREAGKAAAEAPTLEIVEPLADGRYRVTVGSPRRTVWGTADSMVVAAGARVPLRWGWKREENVLKLEGSKSLVLRAGSLAQPIRACSKGWPRRSLVVIESTFERDEDEAARQLAIRLLDRGSADQVLVGTDWAQELKGWLGESAALNANTQLLVVLPESADAEAAARAIKDHAGPWAVTSAAAFRGLAEDSLTFANGVKSVHNVPGLVVHHHKPNLSVRVAAGPEWKRDATSGMEWVSVCRGTFTMGEDESDDQSRIVTLRNFEITRTEITNAQYKASDPSHEPRFGGREDPVPVTEIDWAQARAFCQDYRAGDLPTEAQWEYAARGGSRTRWSFGDAEEALGKYAWFSGNSSDQAHPVGTKDPNPLGLRDMHGNVWEWVRDWYGEYRSGFFVDPSGPGSDGGRVLRGGSFVDPPADLRSAHRVVFNPTGAGTGPSGSVAFASRPSLEPLILLIF